LLERIPAAAVDNVGQCQVGQGWLYCRGTQPIESIDADVVVFDELDYSDQANIEASERRVTGPMSAGLLRRVGVPTVPGFGVSAALDASDQRIWTVKCDACGLVESDARPGGVRGERRPGQSGDRLPQL